MNQLLKSMFSAITVRFISIWAKLRLLTSPLWWRTKGFNTLRTFFAKLFNVKPRNKKDYYTILGWMVSKKLAFAVTIIVGVLSVYYILAFSPLALKGAGPDGGNLPAYKYNSIPLKFAKGDVRIKAGSGYIAYIGKVEKGQVKGQGKLYGKDGNLIYEGDFDKNMYNGTGRLYYDTGGLKYEGGFADNIYQGLGKQYRAAGSLEYDGEFLYGERNGRGMLYNASGAQIYEGVFQTGHILYSELIGKNTSAVADMYTGLQNVYSFENDYCVEMREINAVYAVDGGQDTLEADWVIKNVLVLEDSVYMGNKSLNQINQLTEYLGTPDYYGETWVNLAEAVTINLIDNKSITGTVEMDKTAVFDNVFNVNDYDMDFGVYIFAYRIDGLLYTFYCTGSSAQNFFMYAITSD